MLLLDDRLRRRLALDHYEAGIVQELLRVDARFFRPTFFRTRLRRHGLMESRLRLALLVALRFLVPGLLGA